MVEPDSTVNPECSSKMSDTDSEDDNVFAKRKSNQNKTNFSDSDNDSDSKHSTKSSSSSKLSSKITSSSNSQFKSATRKTNFSETEDDSNSKQSAESSPRPKQGDKKAPVSKSQLKSTHRRAFFSDSEDESNSEQKTKTSSPDCNVTKTSYLSSRLKPGEIRKMLSDSEDDSHSKESTQSSPSLKQCIKGALNSSSPKSASLQHTRNSASRSPSLHKSSQNSPLKSSCDEVDSNHKSLVSQLKSRIKNRLATLSSSDEDIPKSKSLFMKSKPHKESSDELLTQHNEFKKRLIDTFAGSDEEEISNSHGTRKVQDKHAGKFQKLKKSKKKIVTEEERLETMDKLSKLCESESSESEKEQPYEEPVCHKLKKYNPKKAKPPSQNKEKRMSAQVAKQNMEAILSESNRMLREKEVTLPYHKPKQRSLREILNRRKPITGNDGKCLPIKMNEDQLKQYAKQLEERQKEIIELYKSDTEEEEDQEPEDNKENNIPIKTEKNLNEVTDLMAIEKNEELGGSKNTDELNNAELASVCMVTSKSDVHDPDNAQVSENTDSSSKDITHDNETESMHLVYDTENTEANTKYCNSEIAVEKTDNDNCGPKESNQNIDINNVDQDLELPNKAVDLNQYSNDHSEIENINSISEMQNLNNYSDKEKLDNDTEMECVDKCSEMKNLDSENICLEYNTENTVNDSEKLEYQKDISDLEFDKLVERAFREDFSDVEMGEDAIESVEIIEKQVEAKQNFDVKVKPKIVGAPGMVISLDEEDNAAPPKKLSGLDLLKTRFLYFTNIKTADDVEREQKQKIKPGNQHQRLRKELEDKMAEQRSLEWAKRLQEETERMKENQTELSDCEEALEEDCALAKDVADDEESKVEEPESSGEEEPMENDVDLEEKPRKKNPFADDEAEVSDSLDQSDDDESDSSSESSADESDAEQSDKKKSRILKAFEDSDEEGEAKMKDEESKVNVEGVVDDEGKWNASVEEHSDLASGGSAEIFATPGSKDERISSTMNLDVNLSESQIDTQLDEEADMEHIIGLCSGRFPTQKPQKNTPEENPEKSPLNESETPDIYCENENVIPESDTAVSDVLEGVEENVAEEKEESFRDSEEAVPEYIKELIDGGNTQGTSEDLLLMCTGGFSEDIIKSNQKSTSELTEQHDKSRKSILEELISEDAEQNSSKFFQKNLQSKGRFIVSSDDEEDKDSKKEMRKKKKKRKDFEKRKLNISDDEEESLDNMLEDEAELESNSEIDEIGEEDKIVEYDSEENEVQVDSRKIKKMANRFFENEAELTSEDEWAGSADEDEKGLDRFEREEGDLDDLDMDDVKKQLYKTHMRDMLDQDKHEVRMLQEILLEDGDLTGESRQRKFRWNNNDGFDAAAVGPLMDGEDDEEMESEEIWRRQRHERQLFLNKQMEKPNENESPQRTRTSLIKASLSSKTVIVRDEEVFSEGVTHAIQIEKKCVRDIPSPIKSGPLSIMQSLTNRSMFSRGSLTRLAALADPIAHSTSVNMSSVNNPGKKNFVFAAISPEVKIGDGESKKAKRKAELEIGTPKLIKKIKRDDKPNRSLFNRIVS